MTSAASPTVPSLLVARPSVLTATRVLVARLGRAAAGFVLTVVGLGAIGQPRA
jgi:hypothetical protein